MRFAITCTVVSRSEQALFVSICSIPVTSITKGLDCLDQQDVTGRTNSRPERRLPLISMLDRRRRADLAMTGGFMDAAETGFAAGKTIIS